MGAPAHAQLPSFWDVYITAGLRVQAPLLRATLSCYACCGQTVQPTLVSGQPHVMVTTLGFNANAGGAARSQWTEDARKATPAFQEQTTLIRNLNILRQVRPLWWILRWFRTPCILSHASAGLRHSSLQGSISSITVVVMHLQLLARGLGWLNGLLADL